MPWMLVVKPYVQWKEMKKIQNQGYVGLAHGDGPQEDMVRRSGDLEGEGEGNGRAIAEEIDEEHVCVLTYLKLDG